VSDNHTTETEQKPKRGAEAVAKAKAGADFVRLRVAQIVWLVCVLAAIVLAVGALLIALEANADNDLVTWVLDMADRIDLSVFDRDNGIKDFTGKNAEIKEALLNWGLAAIVWLIAGKIVDRIIRP
jgi:hypothetical protein